MEVPVSSSILLECGSQLVPTRQNGIRVTWNRNGEELGEDEMNVSMFEALATPL